MAFVVLKLNGTKVGEIKDTEDPIEVLIDGKMQRVTPFDEGFFIENQRETMAVFRHNNSVLNELHLDDRRLRASSPTSKER
jgi:hypothetical protein